MSNRRTDKVVGSRMPRVGRPPKGKSSPPEIPRAGPELGRRVLESHFRQPSAKQTAGYDMNATPNHLPMLAELIRLPCGGFRVSIGGQEFLVSFDRKSTPSRDDAKPDFLPPIDTECHGGAQEDTRVPNHSVPTIIPPRTRVGLDRQRLATEKNSASKNTPGKKSDDNNRPDPFFDPFFFFA